MLRAPIAYYENWTLSRRGLYYATEKARGSEWVDPFYWGRAPTEYTIRFFDFDSGEVTEVFRTEGPVTHSGLALSPDEQWLLYTERAVAQAELMLVEDFR